MLRCCVLGSALVILTAPVLAQSTSNWPVGKFKRYRLDSAAMGNPEARSAAVYSEAVTVEGAIWIRLYFDKIELETGSFVRMTSAFDDEVQELDADGMAMWHNTSAYFNGDVVYLELVAGPHTTKNHLIIDRVEVYGIDVEQRGGCTWPCGMCGADSRVPSDEYWSGRLSSGCTASVFSSTSCLVSAGHCMGGSQVIQFNVPDSNPNCSTNASPVEDQFPVTSYLHTNGGVGNDWAVMTTGTNTLGQTIVERYGEFRPIATTAPSVGQSVAVWGYGIDGDPAECYLSQTQQTHSASVASVSSTSFNHLVDITCGNSGSGVIRNDEILGIVTHCPCPGVATRVDHSGFAAARAQLCPTDSDFDPPDPDPMCFSTPTYALSTSELRMTACEATDQISPPAQYQFDFVSGGAGGSGSGWQTSRTYSDYGLSVNTNYCHRVRARDSASPPNETQYSASTCAYTLANTPASPTFSGATAYTVELNVNPNGNLPDTQFVVRCSSSSSGDSDWDGKYVDPDGNPVDSPVWQTEGTWDAVTIQALNANTTYDFNVAARNGDLIETNFGQPGSATTAECGIATECDDGDACTLDECSDPPAGTCNSTYGSRPYGDVLPFGSIVPPCPADPQGELGDGFANMLDVFCAFDTFHDGFPYTLCPCADIAPCGGDGFVNMLDVWAIFKAFNEMPICPVPCP